jgi:hypothetical protein
MVEVYCTLFNRKYAHYGLTLYRMFRKYSKAKIYIFPFDSETYDLLINTSLKNVVIVRQSEFEDDELLKVKPTRSIAEYCWTCTSSIIRHVLKVYNEQLCVYLDADLGFFNDPKLLLEEFGDKSVLITGHNFSPENRHHEQHSGIYNVQFVGFRNDSYGNTVLEWWRDRCLEWCYARVDGDKFGDQKYLNEWPQKFDGVHVLQHIGGGVAPWNATRFVITEEDGVLIVNEGSIKQPLVFYHFHDFCPKKLSVNYNIPKSVTDFVYPKYLNTIQEFNDEIAAIT